MKREGHFRRIQALSIIRAKGSGLHLHEWTWWNNVFNSNSNDQDKQHYYYQVLATLTQFHPLFSASIGRNMML